jgi:cysteine-rich repeat protein
LPGRQPDAPEDDVRGVVSGRRRSRAGALVPAVFALACLGGCPGEVPPCTPSVTATTVPGMAAPRARVMRLGFLDGAEPLTFGPGGARRVALEVSSVDEIALVIGGSGDSDIDEVARAAAGATLSRGGYLAARQSGRWRRDVDARSLGARGALYLVRVRGDVHSDVSARMTAELARAPGSACDAPATGGLVPRLRLEAVSGVCGDGRIEGAEHCDDGNASAGDGCAACVVSPLACLDPATASWRGWRCAGEPSRCQETGPCDPSSPREHCWGGDVTVGAVLDGRSAPGAPAPVVTSRAVGEAPSELPALSCGNDLVFDRLRERGTCRAVFGPCVEVDLVPEPGSGAAFAGWMGACAGAATCRLRADRERRALAVFDATSDGLRWAVTFAGQEVKPTRVAVAEGGVRVVGGFRDSLAVGGKTLRAHGGGLETFLLALDARGAPLWAHATAASDVALAPDGTTVVFTGATSAELRRYSPAGALLDSFAVAGGVEHGVLALDGSALLATTADGVRVLARAADGAWRWSSVIAASPSRGRAIARRGDRTAVVVDSLATLRVAELAADGSVAWGRDLALAPVLGETLLRRLSVGFGAAGQILVLGAFADPPHPSREGLRLVELSPRGDVVRETPLSPADGRDQLDLLRGLAIASALHERGALVLVDHDVGPADTRHGGFAVFALDSAGTALWTERHGPRALGSALAPTALAATSAGESIVAGHYNGPIQLRGRALATQGHGLFVARLAP